MERFRKAFRSLQRDDGLGGSRRLAPAARALIGQHAQDDAIHQHLDKKRNAFKLAVVILRPGRAADRIVAVQIDDAIRRSKGVARPSSSFCEVLDVSFLARGGGVIRSGHHSRRPRAAAQRRTHPRSEAAGTRGGTFPFRAGRWPGYMEPGHLPSWQAGQDNR